MGKSPGTIDGVSYSTSISNVPIWLGARYIVVLLIASLRYRVQESYFSASPVMKSASANCNAESGAISAR